MTTNSTSNLIPKQEIVGMQYIATKKRQGSFGFFDEEVDTNDKEFIDECIDKNKGYHYFDKYGNEYGIDEINRLSKL